MRLRISCLAALVILLGLPARAQESVSRALFKPASVSSPVWLSVATDSLRYDSAAASLPPTKSTTTAVLLSAVLPGAGQIYTGRYWKVPIILGFGGYFASQWFRMNDHYKQSRALYSTSVENKINNGQGDPQLLYERDFYHDERDRFAFYFAITYLLNLVDAYVGASLYGFEVGDNLGSTSVKISIPIH